MDDYVWGSFDMFSDYYRKLEADGIIKRPPMGGSLTKAEIKDQLKSPTRKSLHGSKTRSTLAAKR